MFPIVGLGASAGGVVALQEVMAAVPFDTNMAIVIAVHLSPTYRSMLADILSRATPLPTCQAVNRMRVNPGRVYVIPPGKDLIVEDDVLRTHPRMRRGDVYRPIDILMESIALERGTACVGAVLSGLGSDGTLGIRAIKASGGLTLAQDRSAQHDGMPVSAAATGCVDYVLGTREIGLRLGFTEHASRRRRVAG